MVFRKPYAFFIKNFRKIHVIILLLGIFVAVKVSGMVSFIKDYISFGTYNDSIEPFSANTGVLFYLTILLILASCLVLLIVLLRKNKPWKMYMLPVGVYVMILVGAILGDSYFASYTLTSEISGILPARDVLNIAMFLQIPVLIFLIVRIFGLDLKKFEFNKDEEFLELDEDDRAEFEISFSFDKHSIIRTFNMLKRNAKYYYLEHLFFCNVAIVVSVIFLAYSTVNFLNQHRSFKQNQPFTAGAYRITIKDSFVTDKDLAGNVIENNSKFVMVIVNIKNISNVKLTPNLDRFHLMNKNSDVISTQYYNSLFTDLGKGSDANSELSPEGERTFFMIFKTNNKLNNKKYVLYYQELGGKMTSYLRKIKIKVKDVSKISDAGTYDIDKKIVFDYVNGEKQTVTFNNKAIGNSFLYSRYYCGDADSCSIDELPVESKDGYGIIYLSFASSDFEGEELMNFTEKYGKIRYMNRGGMTEYEDIRNAVKTDYEGKEMFIKVKQKILDSKKIDIVYTLRDKRYILKIK